MTDEQTTEQEQPVYMFYYWNDQVTGQPQMQMLPDYILYFQ
jgi:hypothetical protein